MTPAKSNPPARFTVEIMVKDSPFPHFFEANEPTELRENIDEGLWEFETEELYFAFPLENLVYFLEREAIDG